MREQIEQRLQELRQEYDSGQKMLVDLDEKRNNVQQTILRISGAIQVLEEMLAAEDGQSAPVPRNDALHQDVIIGESQ